MSARDSLGPFLFNLPTSVHWEFCRVMDGLSDLDWTRFASEVLADQTAVRLAARTASRTDFVMNQWENRNGRVGELIDLLERLQLLRPRDVILGWSSRQSSPSPSPRPSPPHPPSPPAPPIQSTTVTEGGERPLPRPDPPPFNLHSGPLQPLQPPPVEQCSSGSCGGSGSGSSSSSSTSTSTSTSTSSTSSISSSSSSSSVGSSAVMCWSYEEVHAGTQGFSPSLQVGEGGFGIVYRATLRNIDCAVKRLKQDCLLDCTLLKESFHSEVDKLTKFRHPNIVDLLGFSEGRGSVCLIYSYMHNKSLEDQLHNECVSLSWRQRIGVVEGASAALQFLHAPPNRHTPLIHGDVKSSNILLDHHLVAKLADFGLARFAHRSSSGRSAVQTASVAKTSTIRGTLAYLPDEYVRSGELGTAVDVYSFGVVLLEVLTGRRALEKHGKTGERYLKDLVDEVEGSPADLYEAAWRKQLDCSLITGGAAEPTGYMDIVSVACRCLDKKRKKRPAMTEVFQKLQDINNIMRKTTSSSSSFWSLPPPQPLHSSSSLPSPPCSLPPLSSFAGPCETDESRGFSQYDIRSQFRSNGTTFKSLSPSNKDQCHRPSGSMESPLNQTSVPTEDQYNFPPQSTNTSVRSGTGLVTGAPAEPDIRGQDTAGAKAGATAGLHDVPESLFQVGCLQSLQPSVHTNPSKKTTLEEEGGAQTPELLSSDDLYGGSSSLKFRGPEESDELDYLPAKHD